MEIAVGLKNWQFRVTSADSAEELLPTTTTRRQLGVLCTAAIQIHLFR